MKDCLLTFFISCKYNEIVVDEDCSSVQCRLLSEDGELNGRPDEVSLFFSSFIAYSGLYSLIYSLIYSAGFTVLLSGSD